MRRATSARVNPAARRASIKAKAISIAGPIRSYAATNSGSRIQFSRTSRYDFVQVSVIRTIN